MRSNVSVLTWGTVYISPEAPLLASVFNEFVSNLERTDIALRYNGLRPPSQHAFGSESEIVEKQGRHRIVWTNTLKNNAINKLSMGYYAHLKAPAYEALYDARLCRRVPI